MPEDDLEDGDEWDYVEEDGGKGLNGEAASRSVPLAEISQQVFQEHGYQGSSTDAETSASDKSQAGSCTCSDLELLSSSDSDWSSSDSIWSDKTVYNDDTKG